MVAKEKQQPVIHVPLVHIEKFVKLFFTSSEDGFVLCFGGKQRMDTRKGG